MDNGLRLQRLLKEGFKGWRMIKSERANLLLRLKQKLGK